MAHYHNGTAHGPLHNEEWALWLRWKGMETHTFATGERETWFTRHSVGIPIDVRIHEVIETPFITRTARAMGAEYTKTESVSLLIVESALAPNWIEFVSLIPYCPMCESFLRDRANMWLWIDFESINLQRNVYDIECFCNNVLGVSVAREYYPDAYGWRIGIFINGLYFIHICWIRHSFSTGEPFHLTKVRCVL